jgi:Xaa-Pro aminopeptidase
MGVKGVPNRVEWIKENLAIGSRVGVDPKLISVSAAKALVESLAGFECVPIESNLIDEIWKGKPAIPANPVFHLADKYTGRSSADKIEKLRGQFAAKKVWGFVATALDEICWFVILSND